MLHTTLITLTTAVNLITVLLGGYYAYRKACTSLLAASILTGVLGLLSAFLNVFNPTTSLLINVLSWLHACSFATAVIYPMALAAHVYTCRVRSETSLTPWILLWGAQAMKVALIGVLASTFYELQFFTDAQSMFYTLLYRMRTPGLFGGLLFLFGLGSVEMLLWWNKPEVDAWLWKEPAAQKAAVATVKAKAPMCTAPVHYSAPAPVERRSEKSGRCYRLENGKFSPDDWDIRIADLVFAAEGRCRGIYRVRRRELNSWLDILTLYVSDQPLLDLRETNQGNWTISWRIADRSEELCYGLVKDLYVLFR